VQLFVVLVPAISPSKSQVEISVRGREGGRTVTPLVSLYQL
jgi:hypothetical protein